MLAFEVTEGNPEDNHGVFQGSLETSVGISGWWTTSISDDGRPVGSSGG